MRQAARAREEQLKKDKQELEMRERRKRAEDANRICSITHENAENKRLSHVQNEMGNLMHHDEQELLSVWEGWQWDDIKGGWLDPELCTRARREEKKWSTSVATRCTQESPEKLAYVRLEGRPSRQDGRRRTRGNKDSPMCARGGSRSSTRRTRGQSCTRQRRHSRR